MGQDELKSAIRSEWEAGGISFKALAQKYGKPEGTLKSWAKREGWQRCNYETDATERKKVATVDATVSEKVATEEERQKCDWESLRIDFITGDYKSLKDFADSKGIPYKSHFRERASGWIDEKQTKDRQTADKIISETIQKTAAKASDEFSDFAVETARTLLEVYEENLSAERLLIAKLYQRTDQLIDQVDLEQVFIKSKKRKKMKFDLVKGHEMTTGRETAVPGEMELIHEEEEIDLDIIPGLVNGKKYEAAVKGLARIQQMNCIAFGIDREERREDMLLQKQANKPVGEGAVNEGELIVRFVDGD